jgi:hypothetical protein
VKTTQRREGRRGYLGFRPASLLCVLGVSAVLLPACKRKHVPVETVPELGYPTCGDAGVDEPGIVAGQGRLRAGPLSVEKNVVERFELRRTSCGYAFHSRQEWPLAIADVEVRYDATLTPVWAWKRMTIAGSPRADGNADIRRYELRTGDVFIKHRDDHGELTMEKLLPGGRMTVPAGAKVGAVVGPGRGVITAWLQREKLPVGGKTQELVLDFRDMIESLEEGTLVRNPDLYEPSLGKTVRAYTFFGKETVFADENDVVIGDLAGMRPGDSLKTTEPPALPMYGAPDPVHTP